MREIEIEREGEIEIDRERERERIHIQCSDIFSLKYEIVQLNNVTDTFTHYGVTLLSATTVIGVLSLTTEGRVAVAERDPVRAIFRMFTSAELAQVCNLPATQHDTQ